MHEKHIGFGAKITSKKDRKVGELLSEVQPEDLLKFGLIPEFIGRLPVLASLHELDEAALVDILTKPKNALIKQYQKLFDFEKVKLKFTKGAIQGIAREALSRKSGARGLRSIMESIMLDIMYDVPSKSNIEECVISEEVVTHKEKPIIVYQREAESA
jgi:ATP-dependent Clp protease ATP-binding subunit ClpX